MRRYMAGHDPGVCAQVSAARTEWLLGYPERALQRAQEGVHLAQELRHPFSLAFALVNATPVYLWRGDREPLKQAVEVLQALAAEHDFQRFANSVGTLAGWLVVEQGRSEDGLAQIRQWRSTASTAGPQEDIYVGLLAEAARRAGHPDEGLVAVAAPLANSTAGVFYEAELRRVQGELHLAQGATEADAERCFQ